MSDAVRGADTLTDGFVDLVCADPLLLRAEFDALINASWESVPPDPPTSTRTLVGVVDPDRRTGDVRLAVSWAGRPRLRPPRIEDVAHQRSPPALGR